MVDLLAKNKLKYYFYIISHFFIYEKIMKKLNYK